jgi:hypothetical protein
MWNITGFYTFILRNCGECKMQLDSTMDLTHSKWIIQLRYHVESWRDVKKSLTIIRECVNKVKCYLIFTSTIWNY